MTALACGARAQSSGTVAAEPVAVSSAAVAASTPSAPAPIEVSSQAATAASVAASTPTPEVAVSTAAAPQISSAAVSVPVSTAAVSAVAASSAAAPAVSTETLPGMQAAVEEAPPGPWWVGAIAVQGNKHVKDKVIRGQIKAHEGDLYTKADIDKDIQSLMGTGEFDKAQAEATSMAGKPVPDRFLKAVGSTVAVRLTYIVAEKPVIADIKWKGNDNIWKSTLADELDMKVRDPYDPFKLRTGVGKMLDKYHDKGYGDADIHTKVAPHKGAPDQVDIEVDIKEGPRTRVAAVLVDGVKVFKTKKIVGQMENRPKKIFDPKKLDDDYKAIEKYYKTRGYEEYKLLDSTYTYNENRSSVTIHLQIQEGQLSKFGQTTFSGNTVFTEKELKEKITYKPGREFDAERFEETILGVQELYADKGRLRTKIDPEKTFNEATKLTDIEFRLTEGDVVYVDHVDVEGNTVTKTYVLRREIVQKESQPFSAAKVKKSQQRLMNLGFLEDVNVDVQTPGDPDHVDLVFGITEGKPGMLTAGAGYSSVEGLVGTLSVTHLNLFGRAQSISLVWQFGTRVNDITLDWSERWIGTSPTGLDIKVFDTNNLKPFSTTYTAFTDHREGFSTTVSPRFEDDKYQLSVGYSWQHVTISDIDPGLASELTAGTSNISSITTSFARDTRDNRFFPTHGDINSVSLTVAGYGGDVFYYRPGLASNWFIPAFSLGDLPFVVASINRTSWMEPWNGQSQTPVYERFFLGGPDTVRGYTNTGEIGPPTGGNIEYISNLELQFPLVEEHHRTFIQGAFFSDIGGAWTSANDMSPKIGSNQTDLKTSVGFGIRFTNPAFPIRLDFGYGLNHSSGEQPWQVHFGIGNVAF